MTNASRTPADELLPYDVDELRNFAVKMLLRAEVDPDKAEAMAARMIDGDLLGHRTHGLAFLSTYMERITGGHITGNGEITTINDSPGSFSWQANRLPGAWVMEQATEKILQQTQEHPVVTAAIADCSHIGCLQSYLLPFTEKNLVVLMAVSNPGVVSVAPFGGLDPVVTTNPIAMGFPTSGDPVLIDQCTSVASNALFDSYLLEGRKLPGNWLVDPEGHPSDDPQVLTSTPPGSIMPLGGEDFGYKGFALALMVEVLALAIPGYGRRSSPNRFGQGVFLQVIDPERFAGSQAYLDEVDHLVAATKASRVPAGKPPVRLPGEKALKSMREQQRSGVQISQQTHIRLEPWLSKFQLDFPEPIPASAAV
jgi:L-lactate dehydrogenase